MIRRLQALRFFAAALVLVGHSIMEALQHKMPLGPLLQWERLPWGVGVDIFFVISGFIIATASLDRPRGTAAAADFMLHRLIRVWPTYAFFSTLMLVAVVAVPSFLKHAGLGPAWIVASFLFVPWPRPDDGRFYPVLGQGWTLNYEMLFYLAFAAALLLPRRSRLPALCLGGLALIAAGQLLTLPLPLSFYARPVVAEFLFGVLLSVAYRRYAPAPWFGATLILSVLAFLLAVPIDTEVEWRAVGAGIPALGLVAGILFLGEPGERVLGRPWLVLLGNASYALYLSHTFVVNATLLLARKLFGDVPTGLFLLAAFVSSVAVSILVYWTIEKPFLALLKPRFAAAKARAGLRPPVLRRPDRAGL